MIDDDQEGIDSVARALLEACVELRREASQLAPSEREQDELTKFAALERIRNGTGVHASAIRARILELSRANGDEFSVWLTDLFARVRRQA
jgi:hypothetical protein